jgi:anti-sigma regulatory factor (Ser/Thr protein kinase)
MEFRLPIEHSPQTGARVRRAVSRVLQGWHVEDPAGDLLLVTSELAENVIAHTSDGGELHLVLTPGAVLIEMTDTSPEMPELRDPSLTSPRGRGLAIVAAIARRWGTRPRPGGKVIWAEVPLPPQLQPA